MSEQSDKTQSTVSETDGETARKLFVGGLSWQTTEDGLQRYLESLGMEVERVLIMRDKLSGRSRGFGFVILKQQDMLDKAVNGTLQLDGRKIEAKRAIPKRDMEKSGKKLFVGGIPISLTATDFKKFFEQFGAVTDAQVMAERESGRSRGFGFVTFQDDETMEKVLVTQHSIQGKPVEVKRAEPKKVEKQQRPIILPVPAYFSPSGYPYPMAYASNPGAVYGQALTYDPSGYFLAPPHMYAPQFLPIDDGTGGVVYEQYGYYDPAAVASAPSSSASTDNAPLTSPKTGMPSRGSRREVVAGPKGDWNSLDASPSSSLSLVDRVRVVQNEVRKKRGMSNPEPERVRRGSAAQASPGSVNSGRKSVVTMATAGNWRSRVAAGNSTTSTNSTTTTTTTSTTTATTTSASTKEGGSLHKYFQ